MTPAATRRREPGNRPEMPEDLSLPPELAALFHQFYDDLTSGTNYPDPQQLKHQLDVWIRHMLHSPTDLADILKAVSVIHDALTARIITHHVSVFKTRDHRPVPGAFCWISMGSDARKEQVVRTDQDNALIYATPPRSEEKKWDAYFADLTAQVVTDLDRFGFTLCKAVKSGGLNCGIRNGEDRSILSFYLRRLHP